MKIYYRFMCWLLVLILCTNQIFAINYPARIQGGKIRVKTWNNKYPDYFDKERIQVAAANGKCGKFTITATTDTPVYILPLIAHKGEDIRILKYGDKRLKADPLHKNDVVHVVYDWAGSGPEDHYELACLIEDKSSKDKNKKLIDVDCSQYVTILHQQHNIECKMQQVDPTIAIYLREPYFKKTTIGLGVFFGTIYGFIALIGIAGAISKLISRRRQNPPVIFQPAPPPIGNQFIFINTPTPRPQDEGDLS